MFPLPGKGDRNIARTHRTRRRIWPGTVACSAADMPTKFVFDGEQRFACRDCPARCCRLPVAIPLNQEEIARYRAEPWIRERVGGDGMTWIENGKIPTVDAHRILQCIFLDDDGLCAMQKRFGHAFLPQTCQSFPFGFVRNEKGALVAQMSQLCPSIRDGYGELITAKRLTEKLAQKGGEERMSKAMGTRHGRILSQAQYIRVVERWLDRLRSDALPPQVLLELYDWTLAFEDALPGNAEKPSDADVTAAELALLGHASQRDAGTVINNTRRTLIASRESFLLTIGSENNDPID